MRVSSPRRHSKNRNDEPLEVPLSRKTLAACLPTRNGVETLPRLLDSIRPHVDEVCVLDTGSDDGTLELLEQAAHEPGAPIRIEQAAWTGDYSAARNRLFAMASCDYVSWWDDDEILVGGPDLRAALDGSQDVVYVRRVEIYPEGVWRSWQIRIARRDLCEWVGPIHEELRAPVDCAAGVAHPAAVQVLHAPVPADGRHTQAVQAAAAAEHGLTRRIVTTQALGHAHQREWGEAERLLELALDPRAPLPPEERLGPMPSRNPIAVRQVLADIRRERGDLKGAQLADLEANAIQAQYRRTNRVYATTYDLDLAYPVTADDPAVARLLNARRGFVAL